MLKQARVEDISNRRVTRIHGHIVVITHFYPRFLKKNLIHEYVRVLAPTRALLTEFKSQESACGDHDKAFGDVSYEQKFQISESGWSELQRLTELSRERDVYLVCHCELKQCCHRELVLLAALEIFGATVPKLSHGYDVFLKRLSESSDVLAKARSALSLSGSQR